MSYVDEVIEQVVAQNPAEPEFHQAVKEVLESLTLLIKVFSLFEYSSSKSCIKYSLIKLIALV